MSGSRRHAGPEKNNWREPHSAGVPENKELGPIFCPVHRGSHQCDCSTFYRLWSSIMNLPSYGLIADDKDNPMISRKEVLALLEEK